MTRNSAVEVVNVFTAPGCVIAAISVMIVVTKLTAIQQVGLYPDFFVRVSFKTPFTRYGIRMVTISN